MFSSESDFQPHWSLMKSNLHKAVIEIIRISHKIFRRFENRYGTHSSICISLFPFLTEQNAFQWTPLVILCIVLRYTRLKSCYLCSSFYVRAGTEISAIQMHPFLFSCRPLRICLILSSLAMTRVLHFTVIPLVFKNIPCFVLLVGWWWWWWSFCQVCYTINALWCIGQQG